MVDSKGVALVTGASSGIGRAYAEQLALRGYDLVLVARRRDRLDELARSIAATSARRVSVVAADLTNPAQCAQVERVLTDQDDISVLVNSAGVGAIGMMDEVGVDAIDELVRLNVVALSRLTHAALQGFRQRQGGTVINVGSIIALKPANNAAAYAGSKAFVLSFSRALQSQLKGSGISLQVVLPGPTQTEFFEASGSSPSIFPAHLFASATDVVTAALLGLDRGEAVCIPSLPDLHDWEVYDAAIRRLGLAASDGHPAARYRRT